MSTSVNIHVQIERVFNSTFSRDYNTVLIGGYCEPLYQAFRNGKPAQIRYKEDYISSALHEVAHWCIAGEARRKLDDYGYWYHEDGRNPQQQSEFERVEVKPQALESLFSVAAGVKFKISIDNLHGGNESSDCFCDQVKGQAIRYLNEGLPSRASLFLKALIHSFELNNGPMVDQVATMEFAA